MFKRIIYPTDFSESANRSISFALSTAHSHQCELIVFYTYRLISGKGGRGDLNGVSIKREKESTALKKFEKLKRIHPEFSKINYQFVAEVGFADERICSAIKRFNVDLLIMPETIQRKLEKNFDQSKEKFADHFPCSVLLMTNLPVSHQ